MFFSSFNSEINNQPKSRSHTKENIAPEKNPTCIPHPNQETTPITKVSQGIFFYVGLFDLGWVINFSA